MSDPASPSSRRDFIQAMVAGTASLVASQATAQDKPVASSKAPRPKKRYAIVGTGHRATGMWGADVQKGYSDVVEFVGLCDPNPKRAEASRQMMGVNCPVFTKFDEMLDKARPDLV